MAKSKLPKFTLKHDNSKQRWELESDKTDQVVKSFETKAEATASGTLRRVLGPEGGSVKIQKVGGKFQEERTYPRAADPTKSKG